MAFKNRFTSVAKSCSEYSDQELTVIFVENLNQKSAEFKSDKSKLIADEKHDEYPPTVEAAYKSASRYAKSETKPNLQDATTLIAKAIAKDKAKQQEQSDKKASGDTKRSSDGGGGKPNKYPCTTCELLGKPAD